MLYTCSRCSVTETIDTTDVDAIPQEQWSLYADGLCDGCWMSVYLGV